ncbi:MAG: peptide deformylase [Pseudomonadota bacterium]
MALRTILTYPNPRLQKTAKPADCFGPELVQLAEDMVETMRSANGIGLAAPQIGESIRLIVLEVPEEDETKTPVLYKIANPELVKKEGNARIEEGCLSCPHFYTEVGRAETVTIRGQLLDGSPFSVDADGLTAICFQHEIDHLNGKLLVNYVSVVKRTLYRNEMKKWKTEDGTPDRRPAL